MFSLVLGKAEDGPEDARNSRRTAPARTSMLTVSSCGGGRQKARGMKMVSHTNNVRLALERQASGQLGVRRERNAPEIGRAAVLLDKLDGVGGNSPGCFQLSDDPRRNLATALVSELHDGANRQVTSQLHGRSVLVEIGGARGHGK